MTKIHHINCAIIHAPVGGVAVGHCLVLEDRHGIALVDTGVGLKDGPPPHGRFSQELVNMVGFRFDKKYTALQQVMQLGIAPADVSDCVITHMDPDHIGGIADFPWMRVHVSEEEYGAFRSGNPRYVPGQIDGSVLLNIYDSSPETWYGFEARPVLTRFTSRIFLVPLFGHTAGHCGIAIEQPDGWVFHIGDAYYLRDETIDDRHPIGQFAAMRAENNAGRLKNLQKIKTLMQQHPEITVFGYHDPAELESSFHSQAMQAFT